MPLTGTERSNYISYLKDNTTYPMHYLRGLNDDTLYHMYHRIQEAIPQYINEILAKTEETGYVGHHYTRYELTKYTYNELADIRKSLGIRKGRKKVVKIEQAPTKTLEDAKSHIKQMSIEELERAIYEHEEFLTHKELESAYGQDIPSREDLIKKGIVNLDANDERYLDIYRMQERVRFVIIQRLKAINKKMPIFIDLSMKEIESLTYEELVAYYRRISSIIPDIPKFEDITEEEKSKLTF